MISLATASDLGAIDAIYNHAVQTGRQTVSHLYWGGESYERGAPMVYLMHGFIAAGKSTRAREISTRTGALCLNPDDWMEEMLGPDAPEPLFRPALAGLLRRLDALGVELARQGVDVILDYGFWTADSRARIEALLRSHDLPFQWVVCAVSLEECRMRNCRRREQGAGSLTITDETFDILALGFEPMG